MKLSLIIASRGRPVELLRTIAETDANIARPQDTVISVALDDDDASNPVQVPTTRCKLVWNVSQREDSLGAKYNRAARFAPASAYVLGADDNVFKTRGWDDLIREQYAAFNASFGFVYFGRLDGALPTNMALPHRLIERQGFLFPEDWPVWFYDTWVDEIAHTCGRILWANVEVEEIGGRGKSRGVRDVAFWATLFDALRPERMTLGRELSREHNPDWFARQLDQRSEVMELYLASRVVKLRDPATAMQFEKRMSFDAPNDERYQRIKAKAQGKLSALIAERGFPKRLFLGPNGQMGWLPGATAA